MAMEEKTLRIELTPEQASKLEKETDKRVSALKLNLQELESRVAPKLAAN
jgi:hypothetical protein